MDHDEELSVLNLAESNPAILGLAVCFIIDGDGQRVAQDGSGELEADPVVALAVGERLGWMLQA